jgi:oxygen-independent coproporphyrinogen-3 oxidase
MQALSDRLHRLVDVADDVEWTAEANPETFDAGLAGDWRLAGVNRVSLGVQTFHAGALRWMGRMHGPEGPGRAVAAARAGGLENVSIDLIFGLPERLGRDWAGDLERTLALELEHVALYGLTAEPATPLGRWVRDGRETLAPDDTYGDEYLLAAERLPVAGFEHYEVSNFALPGRASRHNGAYWQGVPYVGLGPGAHSYVPPRRSWNVREWDAYRAALADGRMPEDGEETVDAQGRSLERTWLELRTRDGVAGLVPGQRALAARWEADGIALVTGDRIRLTPAGWLLLDRLSIELEEASSHGPGPSHGEGVPAARATDGTG